MLDVTVALVAILPGWRREDDPLAVVSRPTGFVQPASQSKHYCFLWNGERIHQLFLLPAEPKVMVPEDLMRSVTAAWSLRQPTLLASRDSVEALKNRDFSVSMAERRPPSVFSGVRHYPAQMLGQLDRAEGKTMAREIHRLKATSAATITKHGRHADGGGLYLSISPNGGRRWMFLHRCHGKTIELGFGSAPKKGVVAAHVTLADARKLAAAAREMIAKGTNPKDAKKPAVDATFGECAERFIENKAAGWRNAKHGAQWRMTLLGVKSNRKAAELDYCAKNRPMHVDKIATDDVLDVLRHIWQSKPETAPRLRGRIEAVLDAAKVNGHRSGESLARWRGHLEHSLSKRQHLTRGHHAAMPYDDVPAFLIDLRAREAVSARALEFLILTAPRTGEAIGARWTEFDLDRSV
ncbi:integrase family protein [Bradyrhizobium sp. 174]|uniref:tyrosine-type recombinase/integrase n=1 Tax=unclassified Bradyrhizobium TaxID=2631580 RepID=UPI0031F7056E